MEYVTLGDVFATLDESRRSGSPAFVEQGQTPESELADPSSFLVPSTGFTAGKTKLEEEQIRDMYLAVGRNYQIRPGGATYERRLAGVSALRRGGLGQLPEWMPTGTAPTGITIVPAAVVDKKPAPVPPAVGVKAKVSRKKFWLALGIGGGILAVLLLRR